MKTKQYRTAPIPTHDMPKGIPYIVGNEMAERFSYYGMRTILVVFMTQHLINAAGSKAPMTDAEATSWYHLFASATYFFPALGALLADVFLGKYRTIIALSTVYCLGHLALALDGTRFGLALGLTLIAVGSGGIKPCVSAHVGDQFGATNHHLLTKVFGWFYFAINLGAFASTLMTPLLLERFGSHIAFGVPGILMLIATVVFWMGRHKFVHIPAGGTAFFREVFSREGVGSLMRLFVIYAFVSVFWALYDQTGSAWVLQAGHMDRNLFGVEILSSQVQAINPILVMLLIPFFAYVVYPAINTVFPLTPLRKIGIGFFLTVPAFLIPAWVATQIEAGIAPSILWQLLAYAVITMAEVLVSITCLEFSYAQAPKRMKSFVMACFLASVSLGNLFTSAINFWIQNEDGTSKLAGASYYYFFAKAMFVTALLFVPVAMRYRGKTYAQDEAQ